MKITIIVIFFIIWTFYGAVFYGGADQFCFKPSLTIVIISGPFGWIIRSCDYFNEAGKNYQLKHTNWDTGETK